MLIILSGSRAQYQNLMVHGFNDDKCEVSKITFCKKKTIYASINCTVLSTEDIHFFSYLTHHYSITFSVSSIYLLFFFLDSKLEQQASTC
jgi:hypothetical protein